MWEIKLTPIQCHASFIISLTLWEVQNINSFFFMSFYCKHVTYYSPPNVHIYSLLAEQLCCSVMSLLV